MNNIEENVGEIERPLVELVEQLPIAVLEANLQGDVTFINDFGCKTLGYSRDEILGKPFFLLIANEDRSRIIATAQNVMAGKLLGDHEFNCITKDNAPIPAFIYSAPIKNKRGEVTGLRGIVVRVNRDKNIEATIRASEEKYRTLVNNIKLGITRCSPGLHGRFLEANEAMEKITGYSREELLLMQVIDLYANPDDRGSFYNTVVQNNGNTQKELMIKRKGGVVIIASANLTPVRDPQGNIIYLDGILEDISERKKGELELIESENKFRILAEQSPNMIFINTCSRIAYVNNKCVELLGYSKEEFYAQDFKFLSLIERESQDLVIKNFSRRKQGEEIGSYEYTLVAKNGNKIDVIISMNSINYQKEPGFMGTVTDITQRKKLEERNLDLYTQEKKHREELQEEAKSRGMFIDILAHELRTPLTTVIASSEMLLDLKDKRSDIRKKLTGNIYNSTQTLARRLEELLDLARFSRGTFKANFNSIDLKSFIDAVIDRFGPYLELRNQQLIQDIPENLPEAEIDISRLEQVIINLLSNASKFSSERSSIIFRVSVDGREFQIDVTDNGIGIALESQARLFEPYHRVEQDRHQFSGLGLGLAVSKQIVEAHNGKIWVTSKLGEGSTFSFRMPLQQNKLGNLINTSPCTNPDDNEAISI